jgi:polo-like kinase 1
VYYERRIENTDVEPHHIYSIKEYPPALTKKIGLLQQFKTVLKIEEEKGNGTKSSESPIHLKKWIKTAHAFMFRISNKVFQIIFTDKTQVIIFSALQKLYYLNKANDGSMFELKEALDTTKPELSKRIRYAKEILAQTIKPNKAKT